MIGLIVKNNQIYEEELPPPLTNLGQGKGHRFKDYSNQIINNIEILYPVSRTNDGHILYLMKCYCGKYFICRPQALKSKNTSSCGCYKKESIIKRNHIKTEEIINHQFGELYVLNFEEYRIDSQGFRNAYYKCLCKNCGQQSVHRGSDLKNGSIQSCGCIKSKKELEIKNFLTNNKIEFKQQFTFGDLKDKTTQYPLRFDFAIFKNSQLICLIEYQGEQHYNINNPWYSELLALHDAQKRWYCEKNNIILIELNKNDNLNNLIQILQARGIIL